jgi:radical SAM superfamily enzyme YgiQ (UPF0313 family)
MRPRPLPLRRPGASRRSAAAQPADILLALCPAWGVDAPPLGLAYLSRYLREHGFGTEILDFNIDTYNTFARTHGHLWNCEQIYQWYDPQNFQRLLAVFEDRLQSCVDAIVESRIPVVGFSVFDSNAYFTIEVIRRVKRRDPMRRILLGGPSVFGESGRRIFSEHLEKEVDAFVCGEGEETLLEVMKAIRAGKWDPGPAGSDIPGTVVRGSERFHQASRRAQIADLDSIPYPDFEGFELGAYARPILFLFGSRGCISSCQYCREIVLWKKYRVRSAEHIHAEIEHHARQHGIREFGFSDSLINGNLRNLERLCDLLIERGPRIRWSAQAIARRHMSEELLRKMRASGCHLLSFGIESGSDEVLRSMGKIFTSAESAEVLARTSRAAIVTSTNLILGFPGETEEDYRKTLDFLSENQRNIDRIDFMQACDVLADTALSGKLDDHGIAIPEDKGEFLWYTEDGTNTYQVRKTRVLGAAEHIRGLSSFSDCQYLYQR